MGGGSGLWAREGGGGGADGQGGTGVLKFAGVRLCHCGCAKSPELLALTGTYYAVSYIPEAAILKGRKSSTEDEHSVVCDFPLSDPTGTGVPLTGLSGVSLLDSRVLPVGEGGACRGAEG